MNTDGPLSESIKDSVTQDANSNETTDQAQLQR